MTLRWQKKKRRSRRVPLTDETRQEYATRKINERREEWSRAGFVVEFHALVDVFYQFGKAYDAGARE